MASVAAAPAGSGTDQMLLYVFVGNSPTTQIDSLGLLPANNRCAVCCMKDETRSENLQYGWKCMPCDQKYAGRSDQACQALGYDRAAPASDCAAFAYGGPRWPPPTCPTPTACPAGFPSSDPTWYNASGSWCKDTPLRQVLHGPPSAVQCYREITIPPYTHTGGCPAARHLCFDADGNCEQADTDSTGDCNGKNSDGTCQIEQCCAALHIWNDVL